MAFGKRLVSNREDKQIGKKWVAQKEELFWPQLASHASACKTRAVVAVRRGVRGSAAAFASASVYHFKRRPTHLKNKTRLSQDTSSSHSNQPELSQPPFIPIRLVLLVSFVCLNLRVVANQNLSPLRNLRSLHGGPCSQRLLQQIRPPLLSGLVKLACYAPTRQYPRPHLRHQHLPAYRRSTDSLVARLGAGAYRARAAAEPKRASL